MVYRSIGLFLFPTNTTKKGYNNGVMYALYTILTTFSSLLHLLPLSFIHHINISINVFRINTPNPYQHLNLYLNLYFYFYLYRYLYLYLYLCSIILSSSVTVSSSSFIASD